MTNAPSIEWAVIPAAGDGVRARPDSRTLPKVLWEIEGVSLIERNILLLHAQMEIRQFIVITGYHHELLVTKLKPLQNLGLHLHFVRCPNPSVGLATGLLEAEPFLTGPFVTVLGDELYLESRHDRLRSAWTNDTQGLCGVLEHQCASRIRKNYAVDCNGWEIRHLSEKPEHPHDGLLGVGTYVFTPEIFNFIRRTPASAKSGRVELADALSRMAQTHHITAVPLGGHYFNINTREDYNEAMHFVRSRKLAQQKVSVVVPARNEESSITTVVRDFLPHVHEVLVVNNRSTDQTDARARAAGARVENVSLKGYGDTIRHGLRAAQGDILVVVEADHSFWSADLGKLLEYLKDSDFVVGTRTARPLIESGTNMHGPVRLVNIVVAKIVEALWLNRRVRLTDVGCTYRAIWRDVYERLEPQLSGTGPEFAPEMVVEALRNNLRVLEVPVSYHPRTSGESKHSKTLFHLARTALRMLRLILARRLMNPKKSLQTDRRNELVPRDHINEVQGIRARRIDGQAES